MRQGWGLVAAAKTQMATSASSVTMWRTATLRVILRLEAPMEMEMEALLAKAMEMEMEMEAPAQP